MQTIKNPTNDTLIVPGIPAFAPGEERKVSDADAAALTNGTQLVIVVADPPKAKKPAPTA